MSGILKAHDLIICILVAMFLFDRNFNTAACLFGWYSLTWLVRIGLAGRRR